MEDDYATCSLWYGSGKSKIYPYPSEMLQQPKIQLRVAQKQQRSARTTTFI